MVERAQPENAQVSDAKEATNAAQVFISYSSHDAAVAQAVCSALEKAGFPCWIAPRDVVPGTLYAEGIIRAINESAILVLILSESAVASPHVGKELERSASKRHPIIAIRVDNSPLTPAFEYFLSESQWVDQGTDGRDAAIDKLVDAVRLHLMPAAGSAQLKSPETPVDRPRPRLPRPTRIAAAILLVVAVAALSAGKLWLWKATSSDSLTSATANVAKEQSIAVLPFTDMSETKDQEYFADGMAEELVDLLARIPGLKVIGRTSSFQFKGRNEDLRTIGARLGAAYVVEGSVRKAGLRVRITAQLIDTDSGTPHWSETYDRDFGDVLALQDEIATGIARALQIAVDADKNHALRHLQSTEAYTLYLRGRVLQDQTHAAQLLEAARAFDQALVIDPLFLHAAEALAVTYIMQGFDEDVLSREAWQHAREAAEKALRIDPNSAPAHGVLGFVHAEDEFDWNAAELEFSKGLALNPRDPITLGYSAIVAQARGQYQEAQRRINASLTLDPLNPFTRYTLGDILYKSADFDGAERSFRSSLASNASTDGAHYMIVRILLARGQVDAALKEIQAEVAIDAKDAGLSMIYHAQGRKLDSDAALARLVKESGETWPYCVATVHAFRGERNDAFEWLEKARLARDSDLLASILGDPELAQIRADPRYKKLLREMNLPV